MNRLKSYLQARTLAKAYLESAKSETAKGKEAVAIYSLIRAVEYLITANNNLQSLAFNQKPKGRKP